MRKTRLAVSEYVKGVRERKRYILSQAITLIESTLKYDQQLAEEVLEALLPFSGKSLRIGITGVPGVGKSTFINALGPYLIDQGQRVAVLSVDPSSERSRGSILGDKTRMPELGHHEAAYVRPSATGSTLGGVARKTRESILLCEAAGYDLILVETVGVGQSETLVHQMVDYFLLLMLAGAGDELQGIKRGIMEMTDMLVINKADGHNQSAAQEAKNEYQNALDLFPPPTSQVKPTVLTCSALESMGLSEMWEAIKHYEQTTLKNGYFANKRKGQRLQWLHDTISQSLKEMFYQHPQVKNQIKVQEQKVLAGETTPTRVVRDLIRLFQYPT